MLAELVLSYFIQSNLSSHLNVSKKPYIDKEVRLELSHDFNPKLSLDMSPYVMLSNDQARIAGAEVEVSYKINERTRIGFYHHSSHSLDQEGVGLNVDAVRLRYKF